MNVTDRVPWTSGVERPRMAPRDRGPGRLVLLAPSLGAIAFVAAEFADHGQVLDSLPRALLVAMACALLIQVALTVATRSSQSGAGLALLALVALLDVRLAVLLLIAFLIWRELARRRQWPFRWQGVATVIAIGFVFSTIRLVSSPAFAPTDLFPRTAQVAAGFVASSDHDIFLILLDGYPRTDTLSSFGYDNHWFEEELVRRGFSVAGASHTNYDFTYSVVPTMFHMAHLSGIDALSGPANGWAEQRRAIRDSLRTTPAVEQLRDAGYWTISTGMPASVMTLSGVDEYIDPGGLNLFERELLGRLSVYSWLEPLVVADHRDRVIGSLEATADVASDPRATFMFSHVLSPHVPFVFNRQGDPPALSCLDACKRFDIYWEFSGLSLANFHAAYRDQVHYLNRLVLETLDRVITESPDAVVVLFSDHGTRSNWNVDDEWFATFFASRTPGHRGVFPDDARPIEIMPRILSAYLDRTIPIPADETYFSPARSLRPLWVERWPN